MFGSYAEFPDVQQMNGAHATAFFFCVVVMAQQTGNLAHSHLKIEHVNAVLVPEVAPHPLDAEVISHLAPAVRMLI